MIMLPKVIWTYARNGKAYQIMAEQVLDFIIDEIKGENGTVLSSPDGKTKLNFTLTENGLPAYSLSYNGVGFIKDSLIGLDTDKGALVKDFSIEKVTRKSVDESWKPVYGERSSVRNHYNQMTVALKSKMVPNISLAVEFRCFDQGLAFRYNLRGDKDQQLVINKELSEFSFADNYQCWTTSYAQGKYSNPKVDSIKSPQERPLVLKVNNSCYAAIAEAGLFDYARMLIGKNKSKKNSLISTITGKATVKLPYSTPWRVIMAAEEPGKLVENNDIILNLNEPCAIKDTSWIKPGKVIREVTLTTQGGKACVDFAVKHNLQYVEFDAGWYGNEYSNKSDASTITVDKKRSPGPLDLHEVIRYGKERGVGIILYVNRRALETQLDTLLPLYRKWGVAGLKYGFVNVGSQKWTCWLHDAIRKAARYQLMVDVHDNYRPTGYSRTYPNLLSQEGILGDEHKHHSAAMNLTQLIPRMICGAGDNTICYFEQRVDKIYSHGFQLAKAVCFYSPWQFLYWYDRPAASPQNIGGAGGKHPVIEEVPELEFFDKIPTVWDDSKVVQSEIGEYAVFARRSGKEWFIGCMNANKRRDIEIAMNFLDKDKTYNGKVYFDDPSVNTVTKVKIESLSINSSATFRRKVNKNNGFVIHLVPAE